MVDGQVVPGSLYVYAPNKVAAIIFTALFALSAAGHIFQSWRNKSWKTTGLHAFCAVLFTVGYAMREYGAFNYMNSDSSKQPLMVYIMSQVFLYVCPPLLELANYHTLSRTFFYVPYEAPIPPARVLAIFGPVMMIVETLNSLGVAFTSNPKSSQGETGKVLVLAAIGIQICLIFTFYCLAGIFHWRCNKNDVHAKPIPTLPFVMYASMSLILIRSIFRMVQHAGNSNVDIANPGGLKSLSPLLRYQASSTPSHIGGVTMLANSMLWNVWHAGRYLPRTKNIFMGEDGRTEMMWDEENPEEQLTVATALTEAMQVLTLGAWGHLSPQKKADLQQKQKEALLSDPDRQV